MNAKHKTINPRAFDQAIVILLYQTILDPQGIVFQRGLLSRSGSPQQDSI